MREIKVRAWDKEAKVMWVWDEGREGWVDKLNICEWMANGDDRFSFMQYTGLKDKNGKDVYEGDVVGEEDVYHFLDRKGWEPAPGAWKIIGEKTKNFTRKEGDDERYIAGYKLHIVEWRDESCGFEPFSDSRDNCGHCGGPLKSSRLEIIGNIWENPELCPTS